MNSKNKKGLDQWLSTHNGDTEEADMLRKIWEATGSYKQNYQPDIEKGLANLRQKTEAPSTGGKFIRMNKNSGWAMRIAAALLLLIVAGFIVKAFLFKAPEQQIVTTDATNQKAITLTDGSKVTLNSNSRLLFPETFTGDERRLRLEGEGFFEVVKDLSKPFIIETDLATIQVLGTSFNVRFFPAEDQLEVFVKTGSVAVFLRNNSQSIQLKAGEKFMLDKKSGQSQVTNDAEANSLAWKSRVLKFKKTPLKEVLLHIERLYDIHIEVNNPALLDCLYTTNIETNRLQELLKVLGTSLSFKIEESAPGNYQLTGEKCPELKGN
jgi:ferric-dicitrate binding protein FerR (iron transport regulator)